MADLLSLDHFRPLVGRVFRLPEVEGVELRLSIAAPLPIRKPTSPTAGLSRAPFELIFLGPKAPILRQQIHRLDAEGLEPLEIFIVPIGPIEDTMGYQAIFN